MSPKSQILKVLRIDHPIAENTPTPRETLLEIWGASKRLFFLCIVFQLNTLFAQSLNEIRNIRAGKHDNFYRVVLETSKKVEAIVKLKDNPYRAIITIPESLWRVGSSPRIGNFQSNIPLSYIFRNDEFGKTNLTLKIDKFQNFQFTKEKIFRLYEK